MSLHFPFDHRMLSSQDRRAPADPALRLGDTAALQPGNKLTILGFGHPAAGMSLISTWNDSPSRGHHP